MVLRCKADRLIYGNLTWFRVTNISESEQIASVQPCRSLELQRRPLSHAVLSSLQGTNVTLELPLPNASRRDEGLYACQVENIKTQERTCLLRRLSLKGEKNVHFSFFWLKILCRSGRSGSQSFTKENHNFIISDWGISLRKILET